VISISEAESIRTTRVSEGRPFTTIKKNIKQPDPVPQAGIDEAVELMQKGAMYRYNVPDAESSVVSLCEKEVTEYTGHKYCVALNSCGSALFLALLCAGVQPGDKVLTNAFTFTAVPSAIQHAQAQAVYVETEEGYRIDVDDLEKKIISSGAKYLMVSHMRGKLASMDRIVALCEKHGVYLIEDAAHALGVEWNGKHSGHHGTISAISSQSYKMLNSGEGGFLLTNDPIVGAKAAVYAGAYEGLAVKHLTVPPLEVFGDLPNLLPNYSLRMHQVTAAIIRPQIKTITERREKYNKRYYSLVERLNSLPHVYIPDQYPEVTIVGDSIQMTFQGMTEDQIELFLWACKARGLPVELFGHPSNARYFKNWKFAPADCELPQTEALIKSTVDIRMPLQWEDSDFDDMFNVVKEAIEDATV
jgi:dTDP-4-amino-4,6-dideoxygalactose transaminase